MLERGIVVDEEKCQLCGSCIEVCLAQLLELEGERIKPAESLNPCIHCYHCMCVCPDDAISVGKVKTLPQLQNRVFSPEDVLHVIRSRRSTRNYQPTMVSRDLIERVIEGGRYAPTGGNSQSIHFTVVKDQQTIEALRETVIGVIRGNRSNMQAVVAGIGERAEKGEAISETEEILGMLSASFLHKTSLFDQGHDTVFYGAPVVIVLHGSPAVQANQYNADVISMCMTLMAESLGLGTCLMGVLPLAGRLAGEPMEKLLQLPAGDQIFMGLVLGHPDIEFLRLPERNPARVTWI